MLDYLKNNKLKVISIISILLVLIACSAYIIKFWKNSISDDPVMWGVFGDFIGGAVNTVISLSSLIILGILSHTISKQSSEENKEINLLLRRHDRFDSLSKFLPEIELVDIKMAKMHKLASKPNSEFDREDLVSEMEVIVNTFNEFYAFVVTFKSRFKHSFKYDFDSNEFKELIINTKLTKDYYDEVIEFVDGEIDQMSGSNLVFDKMTDGLTKVLKSLEKEL